MAIEEEKHKRRDNPHQAKEEDTYNERDDQQDVDGTGGDRAVALITIHNRPMPLLTK